MKTRIAVLSLLLKNIIYLQYYCVDHLEIVQQRSMPTCAHYSCQERRFCFHVRPLVDKNWLGLYKVYVRKRDLMENEQINIYGCQRPRGFLMKHCRTILIAARKCKRPKTPSIKRLVQLCKVKITLLITYTNRFR